MNSYRDLVVWQRAMDMVPAVYVVVSRLPKEERFGLADQMRRAAVSVPANVAEGQARHHRKEFLQHLAFAKGSLAELDTLLLLAARVGGVEPAELVPATAAVQHVARPLNRLIAALRKNRPGATN